MKYLLEKTGIKCVYFSNHFVKLPGIWTVTRARFVDGAELCAGKAAVVTCGYNFVERPLRALFRLWYK